MLSGSSSLIWKKEKLAEMVTRCHSLSLVVPLVVTRCTTRCHSLSFVVTRCHSLYHCCHSLSFVVTRCTIRCHSLSLVVPFVATRYHSLSLNVPLVCLFINDPSNPFHVQKIEIWEKSLFLSIFLIQFFQRYRK